MAGIARGAIVMRVARVLQVQAEREGREAKHRQLRLRAASIGRCVKIAVPRRPRRPASARRDAVAVAEQRIEPGSISKSKRDR